MHCHVLFLQSCNYHVFNSRNVGVKAGPKTFLYLLGLFPDLGIGFGKYGLGLCQEFKKDSMVFGPNLDQDLLQFGLTLAVMP